MKQGQVAEKKGNPGYRAVLRLSAAYTVAMLVAYLGDKTLGFLCPF